MKTEQFNEIIEEQLKTIKNLIIKKQNEYCLFDDRLSNFKTAATLQNASPKQALGGMLAKHTVSIFDMIESNKEYPIELWDEKINDHIVYLLILKCILMEEKENDKI